MLRRPWQTGEALRPHSRLSIPAAASLLSHQSWRAHAPRQSGWSRCRRWSKWTHEAERIAVRVAATRQSKQQKHHPQHGPDTRQSHGGSSSSPNSSDSGSGPDLLPYFLGLGLALILGAGFLFKGQIRRYVDWFIHTVGDYGPWGYVAYGVVYVLLEIIAVPAIPLTMTAGVIFGTVPGTIVVSAASVAAATAGFLIARYAARDKIQELAADNQQFKVIDRAIRKNGFKIIALLRLSPLLPLALSNYFYGLTSVDLGSYVLASWLGMLPGTIAYVIAGSYGRTVLDDGQGELALEWWQVAAGAGVTVLALLYLGNIAKSALDEAEQEAESEAL